ncbi:MAG: glycerol-3-phosphate dehydrogenase/oxidase [Ilumatobacteraceae bacterium]
MPAARLFDRPTMARALADEEFDVLVVGGGVTGLGVAVDAVSRGLRVALVERDDFASGTSSKSSKLIHGGLRYLQQGDVRLVYEALHERQRLYRNAPHLVRVLPFMIPILSKDGVVSKKIARALGSALWMYDVTGGWRIGRFHRRARRNKALSYMPTMNAERLASAYVYYDAEADDAGLCLALARTAAELGAVVINRTSYLGDRRVELDGRSFDVRARVIVDATGVWNRQVPTRPAKGVHLTVPWEKVRNSIAVVIPVPKDRRSLFVVPWGPRPDGTFSHTYVGTTDTGYEGPLDDPQCTRDDIEYVLRALNASVTTGVTVDDVTGTWAGLRPLVVGDDSTSGRTADLSRRHLVTTGDDGTITITGGKLTTYRRMAEDTVDVVVERLGHRGRCRTKRLRLYGHDGRRERAVAELVRLDPSLGAPLIDGLPYRRADVVHAARHEMACSVDDVLSRRTRALLVDRDGAQNAAADVARIMAPILGWDHDREIAEVARFVEICEHERTAAGLREDELHA